jgi:hypothetical protein
MTANCLKKYETKKNSTGHKIISSHCKIKSLDCPQYVWFTTRITSHDSLWTHTTNDCCLDKKIKTNTLASCYFLAAWFLFSKKNLVRKRNMAYVNQYRGDSIWRLFSIYFKLYEVKIIDWNNHDIVAIFFSFFVGSLFDI